MSLETNQRKSVWEWLLHAVGWIFHPAIACFEIPMRVWKRDLHLAIWLWHNDPDRDRGRACAIGYVAHGGHKVALVAMLLFAGLIAIGFLLERLPLLVFKCLVGAFAASAIGLFVSALLSLAALVFAKWKGLRVWIEDSPEPEYAMNYWPPVKGKENVAAIFCLYPILLLFMVGVMAVPEDWMYPIAVCLALFVPPILWVAHTASAETIEDCYVRSDIAIFDKPR